MSDFKLISVLDNLFNRIYFEYEVGMDEMEVLRDEDGKPEVKEIIKLNKKVRKAIGGMGDKIREIKQGKKVEMVEIWKCMEEIHRKFTELYELRIKQEAGK